MQNSNAVKLQAPTFRKSVGREGEQREAPGMGPAGPRRPPTSFFLCQIILHMPLAKCGSSFECLTDRYPRLNGLTRVRFPHRTPLCKPRTAHHLCFHPASHTESGMKPCQLFLCHTNPHHLSLLLELLELPRRQLAPIPAPSTHQGTVLERAALAKPIQ